MVAPIDFPPVVTKTELDRIKCRDEFEKFIAFCPPLNPGDFRVENKFMRLLVRTAHMKAGGIYATKIHGKRHPFELSQGRVSVFTPNVGWQRYQAPYSGVTEPGTERIIVVEEDAIWSTFHETDKTDLHEIEKDLIIPHDNPLLSPEERQRLIDAAQ
jgi:hypothetical protein